MLALRMYNPAEQQSRRCVVPTVSDALPLVADKAVGGSAMSDSEGCTLSIMVARPDVPYMMKTIPHLVRSCKYSFAERVLVIDTAPLHKRYRANPNIASLDQLRACCQQLIQQNVVNLAVEIDYSASTLLRIYAKYFGRLLRHTHDAHGTPIFGYLFAIERALGRYFLHYDSDMLLHQDTGYDWVARGIDLLRNQEEVMIACPLAGPPHPSGPLKQLNEGEGCEYDARGFRRLKTCTSRKFLLDRERLDSVLPLTPAYISTSQRYLGYFTGNSALWTLEFMISEMLKTKGYIRADLASPQAWTVHPLDHDSRFIEKLPSIIERVEAGSFPSSQAGDYDLKLDDW